MSHLMATPFNRPVLLDALSRPFQPPSPPDTEMDYRLQHSTSSRPPHGESTLANESVMLQDGLDFSSSSIHAPDTPGTLSRRGSGLPYQNTGFKAEPRSSRKTISKWLIVVVPPSSFSREHGSLGHTLSSSPPGRLSHGVLMPLFPSMYGQLTAIAREFSFPSTAGICIYLQVTDNGVTLTPRVSDESWPFLWGSFFEDRVPSGQPHGLPIAGRIEFDLDLFKARWFDAWLSSYKRESDPLVLPMASRPVSIFHGRADSRTTIGQEFVDDPIDGPSLLQQRLVSSARPVPRKLSLLDKFETSSVRSASRSTRQQVQSPPSQDGKATTHVSLSPVVQEEEPETAKQELKTLVNTWRASSSVAPSPLTAKGQIALDPINIPNTVPLPDLYENDGVELNLDDFSWSISSAGPPSYPESALSSVFLLPSPDLGQRALDNSLLTPTTATTWGPPLSWPSTPASEFRAPSLDLGARARGSRPVTPSTATTWGPPLSWPPSPVLQSHVNTPGIAERSFEEFQLPRRVHSANWKHVWPYARGIHSGIMANSPDILTSKRALVWRLVWPYIKVDSVMHNTAHWQHVWPYNRREEQSSRQLVNIRLSAAYPIFDLYPTVYPHFELYPHDLSGEVTGIKSLTLGAKYPSLVIYSPVYPTFEVYPGHTITPQEEYRLPAISIKLEKEEIPRVTLLRLPHNYPHLSIYSSVYPYNLETIYPPQSIKPAMSMDTILKYPYLDIYPAVYPHIIPYPSLNIPLKFAQVDSERKLQLSDGSNSVFIRIPVDYPYFNLYPNVYPYFDIYPDISEADSLQSTEDSQLTKGITYPYFNLYPAMYPYFDIYPAPLYEDNLQHTPKLLRKSLPATMTEMRRSVRYPFFNIYPSIYPFFDLYSPHTLAADDLVSQAIEYRLVSKYPNFNIYPAVYPYFDLYFQVQEPVSMPDNEEVFDVQPADVNYPFLVIYTAVYPNFDLYPPLAGSALEETSDHFSVKLPASYPTLEIYSAVYPHFDIYPRSGNLPTRGLTIFVDEVDNDESMTKKDGNAFPSSSLSSGGSYLSPYGIIDMYSAMSPPCSPATDCFEDEGLSRGIQPRYPNFDIYPAAYPFFDIYRSGTASTPESRCELKHELETLSLAPSYPSMIIYRPVYPFFDIYNSGSFSASISEVYGQTVHSRAEYPAFDIYPAAFPHSQIDQYINASDGSQNSTYRRPPRTYKELEGIDLDKDIPLIMRHASHAQANSSEREKWKSRRTHQQLFETVMSELIPKGVLKKSRRKSHQELHDDVFAHEKDEHAHAPGGHKGLVRKVSFADDIVKKPLVKGDADPPIIAPKPVHRTSSLTEAQREMARLVGLPSGPADNLGRRSQSPARNAPTSHSRPALTSSSRTAVHRPTRSLDSPPWPTAFWSAPEQDVAPRHFRSVDLSASEEHRVSLLKASSQGLRRARSVGHSELKSSLARSLTQSAWHAPESNSSSRQLSPVEEGDDSKILPKKALDTSRKDSHTERHRTFLPANPADGLRRASSLTTSHKTNGVVPPDAEPSARTEVTTDRPATNELHNTPHRVFLPSSPYEGLRAKKAEPPSIERVLSPPPAPKVVTTGLEMSQHKKSPSTSPSHGHSHKKRDSIVLEKARAWGQRATESLGPVAHPGNDIVEMPQVPRSPPPPLPSNVVSNGLSRPIAKLDRTKIPFN